MINGNKYTPANQRPELFLIHDECFNTISIGDIDSTISDMENLGINSLPYKKVDIQMKMGTLLSIMCKIIKVDISGIVKEGDNMKELRYQFVDENIKTISLLKEGRLITSFNSVDELKADIRFTMALKGLFDQDLNYNETADIIYDLAYICRNILVILLSTKNVVKTRKENKTLRLGIGLSNEFKPLYTTSLSVPRSEYLADDKDNPPREGRSPRAHLRRGHIRRQHYGPRNSLIKQVWVQPVFVNADSEFVSSRAAYNMSNKELRV